MDIIQRYEEAATGFTARLNAVTDDQWANPTPCTDWDVRELVDHVIAIQRQIPEGLGTPIDDGADVQATWKAVHEGALKVLREPGVLERTMRGIRGDEVAVEMALIPRLSDLHVHTWDLARATGGDERLSTEVAAIVLERLKPNDEALRKSGSFGPKVEPPRDADVQVELLCFLGRRP
ncbi:MAG: TIGR03086 family metal-binding protein [Acidimicrobiia bacterium]